MKIGIVVLEESKRLCTCLKSFNLPFFGCILFVHLPLNIL